MEPTTIQTIIEAALQQGIWAALYIYLFFRMLTENAKREERYQQMIDYLSNNIADGIEDIQNRLDASWREIQKMTDSHRDHPPSEKAFAMILSTH